MASSIRWDRLEWQVYFREIADRLALKDWRIEVTDEAPDSPTAHARVLCVFGRKWIRFQLSEIFLRDPEWNQRLSVTHELIHAHYTMADNIAEDGLDPRQHYAYRQALEYGTDGLADAISPLMPLPSEILDAIPE